MSFICAISNEVPEAPVVSPFSGAVFEKRLIEKYVSENGKDPVSGDCLMADQLIEIKGQTIIKPRPPSATSIPAILKMLQDEWDATMLHSFTLRQQLQTARQELSHALYQHDAACRVIARLSKEVTAAREALATLKPHATGPAALAAEQIHEANAYAEAQPEDVGMTLEVVKKLQEKAAVLTAARKQRGKSVPDNLVKMEAIKNYTQIASHTGLHSASIPGITCLDLHAQDPSLVITGGNDKNAVVFHKEKEQVLATFKGHQKKIEKVIYHPTEPDVCLTASSDATIKIWSVSQQSCQFTVAAHEAAVTGLSLHATGDYVLSVSLDEKWAFSDIRTGRTLSRVAVTDDSGVPQKLTTAQFHPDGLIFGVGTAGGAVKIWDLSEQVGLTNFADHVGPLRALAFSENGYYLATAAEDACVKLWDLRKLRNFKTVKLDDKYEVNDLCFDQSGSYLAVAGTDVRVYHTKQWQELCVLTSHTEAATGVRFGSHAAFLASTGGDRSLRFFGQPPSAADTADDQ